MKLIMEPDKAIEILNDRLNELVFSMDVKLWLHRVKRNLSQIFDPSDDLYSDFEKIRIEGQIIGEEFFYADFLDHSKAMKAIKHCINLVNEHRDEYAGSEIQKREHLVSVVDLDKISFGQIWSAFWKLPIPKIIGAISVGLSLLLGAYYFGVWTQEIRMKAEVNSTIEDYENLIRDIEKERMKKSNPDVLRPN